MAGVGDGDYIPVHTLGEGAFGKVYLVKEVATDIQYAMKVIDLSTAPQDERDLALREAHLLSEFDHEHILKYINSFEEGGALCIVTEFCPNGDVGGFLEARNNRALPENRIVSWFREVASALEYLHGRNILHRDIKTQNLFLMEDNSCKLGDLGLARVLDRPNAKAVTFCGSPYYMSPEIFACRPYDMKSDIWALGVVIYEMATLEKPFEATLMHQLVFKIVHGETPDMPHGQYSGELIQLMEAMLEKDANDRPTSSTILAHELFRKTPRLKTPPRIAPKPSSTDTHSRDMSRRMIASKKDASKFDMGSLMSALSVVQAHKKGKAKAAAGKKGGDFVYDRNYGIDSIMKTTFIDKTKADKTIKNIPKGKGVKPSPGGPATESLVVGSRDADVTGDFSTFGAQSSQSMQHMMNLVVRTLTNMFKDDGETSMKAAASETLVSPETLLLRQIDQLQYHCVRVLGVEKFQKAYDLLGKVKDNKQLEKRLLGAIGEEAFAACGVQLFYCKNFEYNLEKLKDKEWQK